MFLYDKTNILEGSGIFEVDFAPSHRPANVGVSTLPCSHPALRHSSLRCTLWQSTQFLWSTSCLYLHYLSWYHRDAENTGNMRTNFPCGLLSVGSGAWTNPCVSNTTIRGERHYPVENNNPGIGCSVHCTFSSVEEDVETDTLNKCNAILSPCS